ncbi:MAG: hypothetical protein IIY84_01300, partial [Eubacterium sp.]|nr:hypothetical protein [Eubacterium sp.]
MRTRISAVILAAALFMTQSGYCFAEALPAAEDPAAAESVAVEEETAEEAPAEEVLPAETPAEAEEAPVEVAAEVVNEAAEEAAETAAAPEAETAETAIAEAEAAEAKPQAAEEAAAPKVEAPAKANEAAAAPAEKKQTTEEGSEGKKAEEAKAPAVKAAPAASFSFDNTTDIPDGEYTGDAVTFTRTGGTGKAKQTLDKVVVSGGRAMGTFTVSSDSQTHIYLAATASDGEDTALYDPAADAMGAGVYRIEGRTVTIPVKIGTETDYAVRSTAMSAPHWVNYQYTITVDVPETPAAFDFDNTTDIPDGEYTGDAVTFTRTGGTGKAK